MQGLGKRLKELRKSKKLTLVEISKKTGIDQATLSRMENGKMTGTLDSHMQLANVLGVRLPDLYSQVLNKVEEVKEKEFKQKIDTFSHSGGVISEILTTGIFQKKMLPTLIRIKPRGKTATEEYSAESERFVYVLKGVLSVQIGSEKKLLKTGESLYFNARAPHSFQNTTKTESTCLSILTPASP